MDDNDTVEIKQRNGLLHTLTIIVPRYSSILKDGWMVVDVIDGPQHQEIAINDTYWENSFRKHNYKDIKWMVICNPSPARCVSIYLKNRSQGKIAKADYDKMISYVIEIAKEIPLRESLEITTSKIENGFELVFNPFLIENIDDLENELCSNTILDPGTSIDGSHTKIGIIIVKINAPHCSDRDNFEKKIKEIIMVHQIITE